MSIPIFHESVQTDQTTRPRRNRQSAKKAGSSFERQTADYLKLVLDDETIDRRVKTGAKDRGDIAGVKTIRGARLVIECKNVARTDLPAWIREATLEAANDDAAYGVIVHKRHGVADPARQFVTMDLETFALLLQGGPDELRGL